MIRLPDISKRAREEKDGDRGEREKRRQKESDSTQLYCKIGMSEYFSFR